MLFGPGAIIYVIVKALSVMPLAKIPVTALIALIVVSLVVYPRPAGGKILSATVVIAVVGPLAFSLLMWFPGGLLGALLGLAAFWIITSCTLDRVLDVHFDRSYAITGQIVGVSVPLWILLGLAVLLLRKT